MPARRGRAGSPPPAWGIRRPRIAWPRVVGSPPPAWGIRHLDPQRAGHQRFTPTCVGNTPSVRPCRRVAPVHPHLRGEYGVPRGPDSPRRGSPPPAWGILSAAEKKQLDTRFTPTCVGNTGGGSWRHRSTSVHPHLRGEYVGSAHRPAARTGSPPPAWGIRLGRLDRHLP